MCVITPLLNGEKRVNNSEQASFDFIPEVDRVARKWRPCMSEYSSIVIFASVVRI